MEDPLALDERSILYTRGALFRTKRKIIITVYAWCAAPQEAQEDTIYVWCVVVPHEAKATMTATKDDSRRVGEQTQRNRFATRGH